MPEGLASRTWVSLERTELKFELYSVASCSYHLFFHSLASKLIVATSHTPELATAALHKGEYDDAPPGVADSDVSSKESDAMSESSSQKFIETAKRMAGRGSEHDATDYSDRSGDGQAHSQARAYRHHAQAERTRRGGQETDLIG